MKNNHNENFNFKNKKSVKEVRKNGIDNEENYVVKER